METISNYTPEQIKAWQQANNMDVLSLDQICSILMNFEERLKAKELTFFI